MNNSPQHATKFRLNAKKDNCITVTASIKCKIKCNPSIILCFILLDC